MPTVEFQYKTLSHDKVDRLCQMLAGHRTHKKKAPVRFCLRGPQSPSQGRQKIGKLSFAVSRILSNEIRPTNFTWMIIPLGSALLTTSSDLTRKLCMGHAFCASLFGLAPRRVWLFSLQRLVRTSRSRYRSHSLGHSLCSTVPQQTKFLRLCLLEGRYPLRHPIGVRTFLPRAPTDVPQSRRRSSTKLNCQGL